MCSRYQLSFRKEDFSDFPTLTIPNEDPQLSGDFLPYRKAPVIVRSKGGPFVFVPMSFSLVPAWSREPKVKFATHNARLESIGEKPTWKGPLKSQHCLVPMSGFFESAYTGPLAGHIIQFKSPEGKTLFAAGLWDRWQSQDQSQNFFSFSIITTTPTKFIEEYGHDRSPLFLSPEAAAAWLTMKDDNPSHPIQFLSSQTLRPPLVAIEERPLKPGWEKRK
jgi:putative SOS response-associated peptidase YedK